MYSLAISYKSLNNKIELSYFKIFVIYYAFIFYSLMLKKKLEYYNFI